MHDCITTNDILHLLCCSVGRNFDLENPSSSVKVVNKNILVISEGHPLCEILFVYCLQLSATVVIHI